MKSPSISDADKITDTRLELLGVGVLSAGAIGWGNRWYAGRIGKGGLLKVKAHCKVLEDAMGGIALFGSKERIIEAVLSLDEPSSPYEWR